MIPDLKLNNKATVILKVWYWHKNRLRDNGARRESPEINPSIYSKLTYSTGDKNIQ